MKGSDDLHWSGINNSDKGIFSADFVRAFFPDVVGLRTQYMKLSDTVYRECSEYVHGNPETHEDTSSEIAFDKEKLISFHDKVETVRLCIFFGYIVRYLPELDIDQKNSVEYIIIENFGEIPEIHSMFGAK